MTLLNNTYILELQVKEAHPGSLWWWNSLDKVWALQIQHRLNPVPH